MRALCIHNLSGKVSFNNLLTFGTGYAKRKFIAHERIVYNPSLTSDQVYAHTFVAWLTMRRINAQLELNLKLTTWLSVN